MVRSQISTVVIIAAIHTGQSQNVNTEYDGENFHGANIWKKLSVEAVIEKRWRLHSFDFAFGLACALAGKGKCVQCALA